VVQPYVGEIKMFAGTFAPDGWMFCNGQLLAISEYEPLFQLIGTSYGGDGQSVFALPDLRGRVPIHQGGSFVLGESGGAEDVTLVINQLPAHTHPLLASKEPSNTPNPRDNVLGTPATATPFFAAAPNTNFGQQAIRPSVGGGQPHANVQPFLCVNFIIAMQGIFPPPS